MKSAPREATKLALLPVVKENIETGYNITEKNNQKGSYITEGVRSQDQSRELGCEHKEVLRIFEYIKQCLSVWL